MKKSFHLYPVIYIPHIQHVYVCVLAEKLFSSVYLGKCSFTMTFTYLAHKEETMACLHVGIMGRQMNMKRQSATVHKSLFLKTACLFSLEFTYGVIVNRFLKILHYAAYITCKKGQKEVPIFSYFTCMQLVVISCFITNINLLQAPIQMDVFVCIQLVVLHLITKTYSNSLHCCF